MPGCLVGLRRSETVLHDDALYKSTYFTLLCVFSVVLLYVCFMIFFTLLSYFASRLHFSMLVSSHAVTVL